MNYYNENDPKAAAWLRELIEQNLIPKGIVDERSIADVQPADLAEFIQCHFFAGIGGWSLALQLAGWPEDWPIWTGSCPCQPFSCAGKQLAESDERHLWPVFRELIRACKPPVVIGEQVASAAGRLWLAGVQVDLEGMGFEFGAADLCSAGVGAPHIRQRLHWVAYPEFSARQQGWLADESREGAGTAQSGPPAESGRCGDVGGLGDTSFPGLPASQFEELPRKGRWQERGATLKPSRASDGLAHSALSEAARLESQREQLYRQAAWSAFDILECLDGKARRIKSGLEPLAHGLPRGVVSDGPVSLEEAEASGEERKARLKGYGNAINPVLASEFVMAFMDVVL